MKKAISYGKEAANQSVTRKVNNGREISNVGVVLAMHLLGVIYSSSTNDKEDMREAISWYEKALEYEHALSAHNLAEILKKGVEGVVQQDIGRAEKLLILSYKRGNMDAIDSLIRLYLSKNDHDRALLWHERALEKNCLYSIKNDQVVREMLAHLKSGNNFK